jgi:uncharacterized protein (DUF302 family)
MLDTLGLSFLTVPVEKNGVDREELKKISGQQSIPVLVDRGKVVVESSKILDYLNGTFGKDQPSKMESNDYGFRTKIRGSLDEVVEKTVAALKAEGFGVLTDIDVKSTLKKKLGVDVPQQIILGACNPNLAHQALTTEEDLGLLLPCNVVVREAEEGFYWVTAVNPLKLLSIAGRDDLLQVATKVKTKMKTSIESLA